MSALMFSTILASACDAIRFPSSRHRVAPLGGNVLRRLAAEARSAFSNASFRKLFGGVLLIYVLVGTETALALYVYEFFWGLGSREILLLSMVYPAGLVVGAAFTARLHSIWDKCPTLIFGTIGWSAFQILPIVGRLLDVVPQNGTEALIVFLVASRFLQGALVQQGYASFSSMMGDIADEHELATGRRQEGIFFGVVSFSGKAASGLGSFIAGVARRDFLACRNRQEGDAVQSPETIQDLGIVYGPMLAVFAFPAPVAYRGYPLDRERHRSILACCAAPSSGQAEKSRPPSLRTRQPSRRESSSRISSPRSRVPIAEHLRVGIRQRGLEAPSIHIW